VKNDACLGSRWEARFLPSPFPFPTSSLLENVARTGFLNPFDRQLYLESNVFFSAWCMTIVVVFSFFMLFRQGLSSRTTLSRRGFEPNGRTERERGREGERIECVGQSHRVVFKFYTFVHIRSKAHVRASAPSSVSNNIEKYIKYLRSNRQRLSCLFSLKIKAG